MTSFPENANPNYVVETWYDRFMSNEQSGSFIKTLKTVRQESSILLHHGVRINEALWYDMANKDYPNQIGIHLFPMQIGKKYSERKAALKLYAQGLDELARRVETDSENKFSHVTHITGWSKIVYEHPELLEFLGFEITDRDDEKKEALATMTREKFLKRPWETK